MSQQYNDYTFEDEKDLEIDYEDENAVVPGRVMEQYKSKTQEKKAKRKGFKK